MSTIIKKKLKIEGMHCTSCALNIDFDLEDLGVKSSTSYAKQECEVEYKDSEIDLSQIIDSIKKTGYKASLKNDEGKKTN